MAKNMLSIYFCGASLCIFHELYIYEPKGKQEVIVLLITILTAHIVTGWLSDFLLAAFDPVLSMGLFFRISRHTRLKERIFCPTLLDHQKTRHLPCDCKQLVCCALHLITTRLKKNTFLLKGMSSP